MANFKRFSILLSPILLFLVSSADAKLTPAQLDQAQKAYDRAQYGTTLKLLAPARDNDYAAALLEAKTRESFDSLIAVFYYDRAGQLNPSPSVKFMYHGYAIFLTRKYESALEQLENAIKADPKNAVAHALKGLCLFYIDRVDEALSEFKKAQQLDPKTSFDEYIARGWVAAGESKKAEPYFNQLITRNPTSARFYIMRGDFFDEAGKVPQSLADYETATHLNPASQYAHFRYAKLLCASDKYKEAIPEALKGSNLEGIEEFGKKSTRLLFSAYEHTGQYQKAVDVMKPVFLETLHRAQIDGSDRITLLQLVEDFEKLHDYKNAKIAAETVLRVEPKSTEAISKRARVFAELNDTANSLKDYAYLIHSDPTNSQWYKERAKVYQKIGKASEAAADLRKAKEME